MKRILTLFIILVICCSVIISSAEAKEILFRDIPWGSNLNFFKESIGMENFDPYISYLDLWSRWNDVYFSSSDITKYETGYCFMSGDDCNLSVAGYKVFTFGAEFVFGITDEGKLDRSKDAVCLAEADYSFKSEDTEKTYEDLKNKLTSIYGDFEVENDKSIIWKGDNNTAVRLLRSENLVYIRYGKEDLEEQMHQVEELIHQEMFKKEEQQRNDNADDIEGL